MHRAWSLVRRNFTDFGVSECEREASKIGRTWPTGSCRTMKIKILLSRFSCLSLIPSVNVKGQIIFHFLNTTQNVSFARRCCYQTATVEISGRHISYCSVKLQGVCILECQRKLGCLQKYIPSGYTIFSLQMYITSYSGYRTVGQQMYEPQHSEYISLINQSSEI